MNEFEYMKLTNGIDEAFAAEYLELKPKKHKITKRGLHIGLVAAVMLALAVPAAAYGYSRHSQKQSVYVVLPGSSKAADFETDYLMENEHLRRTVDLVVSDGHNVMTVETQEYKDEAGKEFVENHLQGYHLITYTDGSDELVIRDELRGGIPRVGESQVKEYITGDSKGRLMSLYSCKGLHLEKELRITYFANNSTDATPEQFFMTRFPELDWKWVAEYPSEIDNILDGFEYVTSFAPNAESISLRSQDGTEIVMSQFEVYCDTAAADKVFGSNGPGDFRFILKNGEKHPFPSGGVGGKDYRTYGKIIDLDGYAGVEINGVSFLRVEK